MDVPSAEKGSLPGSSSNEIAWRDSLLAVLTRAVETQVRIAEALEELALQMAEREEQGEEDTYMDGSYRDA